MPLILVLPTKILEAIPREGLLKLLHMLPERGYRIGSEQGIVVVRAAVIDQRYRWVVTLEPLIFVEVNELPVVPRQAVNRFRVSGSVGSDQAAEGFEARSALVEID